MNPLEPSPNDSEPVNWLLLNSIVAKVFWVFGLNTFVIGPVSLLSPKKHSTRSMSVEIDVGIVPLNRLPSRNTAAVRGMEENMSGMVPVSRLVEKPKFSKLPRCCKLSGIVPSKALPDRSNTYIKDM